MPSPSADCFCSLVCLAPWNNTLSQHESLSFHTVIIPISEFALDRPSVRSATASRYQKLGNFYRLPGLGAAQRRS